MRLLRNRIVTPDGTVLESRDRHDYVDHVDSNGQYYMLDGGLDYSKSTINIRDCKDERIYDDGNHESRRSLLTWGNHYDKDMNRLSEIKYILIKDLETEHIENILKGQWCKNSFYIEVFNAELNFRKNEQS